MKTKRKNKISAIDKGYFDGLNQKPFDDSDYLCDLEKLEYLYAYELERHRRNLKNLNPDEYLYGRY